MKLRYIATSVMLSTTVSAAGLAMTTVPVTAGTCTTPRCGGVVEFDSGAPSGPGVDISNCWSDSYGKTYLGESPPCTKGLYSLNKYPAMYFVSPGKSSSDYPKYYDTDAFKVGANCVLTTNGTTYDQRGRGSIWYKIYDNLSRIYVLSYRCF